MYTFVPRYHPHHWRVTQEPGWGLRTWSPVCNSALPGRSSLAGICHHNAVSVLCRNHYRLLKTWLIFVCISVLLGGNSLAGIILFIAFAIIPSNQSTPFFLRSATYHPSTGLCALSEVSSSPRLSQLLNYNYNHTQTLNYPGGSPLSTWRSRRSWRLER